MTNQPLWRGHIYIYCSYYKFLILHFSILPQFSRYCFYLVYGLRLCSLQYTFLFWQPIAIAWSEILQIWKEWACSLNTASQTALWTGCFFFFLILPLVLLNSSCKIYLNEKKLGLTRCSTVKLIRIDALLLTVSSTTKLLKFVVDTRMKKGIYFQH